MSSKFIKECVPCSERLNLSEEFNVSDDLVNIFMHWADFSLENAKAINRLLNSTDVYDSYCELLDFFDSQCVVDLKAIFSLLAWQLANLNTALLYNLRSGIFSLLSPFFMPLTGKLTDLLNKYISLVLPKIDCSINSLIDVLDKIPGETEIEEIVYRYKLAKEELSTHEYNIKNRILERDHAILSGSDLSSLKTSSYASADNYGDAIEMIKQVGKRSKSLPRDKYFNFIVKPMADARNKINNKLQELKNDLEGFIRLDASSSSDFAFLIQQITSVKRILSFLEPVINGQFSRSAAGCDGTSFFRKKPDVGQSVPKNTTNNKGDTFGDNTDNTAEVMSRNVAKNEKTIISDEIVLQNLNAILEDSGFEVVTENNKITLKTKDLDKNVVSSVQANFGFFARLSNGIDAKTDSKDFCT